MSRTEDEIRRSHSESIGRLFSQAQRDFRARMTRKLQENGNDDLSPAHMTVLSQLASGELRTVDLAKQMKITKQSASDLIRDLEALGYVERQPDPRDKRAAIIGFTKAGEAFLLDRMQIAAEIDREYKALIGEDGFVQLVALLKRVVEGVAGSE